MSYTILNELTIAEQIETTGRASVTIDVDGCYGGLGGSIRVDVRPESYSDEEPTFEFKVTTNFAPKPSTDIVTALENFTEAMRMVTDTVNYYKIEEHELVAAFARLKESIAAERTEAEKRFSNDTTMFYTAEKAVDELIETARSGSGAYELVLRYRGEDAKTTVIAKKGWDGKVRLEHHGYKTSKKSVINFIQDRCAEVVKLEKY